MAPESRESQQARRVVLGRDVLAILARCPSALLPFGEVREKLRFYPHVLPGSA